MTAPGQRPAMAGILVDGVRRFAVLDGDAALVGGHLPHTWDDALQLSSEALYERCLHPGAARATTVDLSTPLGAHQEVWASGVTYLRSRDARKEESGSADVYDLVYTAARPELFFKAPAWRVVADGDAVGIRADSTWNVPEPELALVVNSRAEIVGVTIGNDMSSRSIEGENPLYLPQAKTYTRSCALGPFVVDVPDVSELEIALAVRRDGIEVFADATGLHNLVRRPQDLVASLFSALDFPHGVVLLTGTGIVPPDDFTLHEQDEIRITLDRVGALTNRVVVV